MEWLQGCDCVDAATGLRDNITVAAPRSGAANIYFSVPAFVVLFRESLLDFQHVCWVAHFVCFAIGKSTIWGIYVFCLLGSEPSQATPGLEVVIVLAIILQFLQKMKQDGMLEEGLYYKFRREVSGARRAAGFWWMSIIFPLQKNSWTASSIVATWFHPNFLSHWCHRLWRPFIHGPAHLPRRDWLVVSMISEWLLRAPQKMVWWSSKRSGMMPVHIHTSAVVDFAAVKFKGYIIYLLFYPNLPI